MGGRMANNGNVHRRSRNWQKLKWSGLVRCVVAVPMNSASRLFRSVIAIIGKLVDNVKTGNSQKNQFEFQLALFAKMSWTRITQNVLSHVDNRQDKPDQVSFTFAIWATVFQDVNKKTVTRWTKKSIWSYETSVMNLVTFGFFSNANENMNKRYIRNVGMNIFESNWTCNNWYGFRSPRKRYFIWSTVSCPNHSWHVWFLDFSHKF